MAKKKVNPSSDIIKRWVYIDAYLGEESGLNVPRFSDAFEVDRKTVYQDLEAFGEAGQKIMYEHDEDGRRWYRYVGGCDFLFTRNRGDGHSRLTGQG